VKSAQNDAFESIQVEALNKCPRIGENKINHCKIKINEINLPLTK